MYLTLVIDKTILGSRVIFSLTKKWILVMDMDYLESKFIRSQSKSNNLVKKSYGLSLFQCIDISYDPLHNLLILKY